MIALGVHNYLWDSDMFQKLKAALKVKRFIREHEAPDFRFAEFVTPQRFCELFPLAATDLPYSCRQLCGLIAVELVERVGWILGLPAKQSLSLKDEANPSEHQRKRWPEIQEPK